MKSTIEELVAFIAIVDTGSFVAAAEHLKQTPSGVSRSLTRLEAKLDVTLLERTTRKLKLTQEGQQFLVKARKILNELNAAEEELQNLIRALRDSFALIQQRRLSYTLLRH